MQYVHSSARATLRLLGVLSIDLMDIQLLDAARGLERAVLILHCLDGHGLAVMKHFVMV